jgi:hypothetical protein
VIAGVGVSNYQYSQLPEWLAVYLWSEVVGGCKDPIAGFRSLLSRIPLWIVLLFYKFKALVGFQRFGIGSFTGLGVREVPHDLQANPRPSA